MCRSARRRPRFNKKFVRAPRQNVSRLLASALLSASCLWQVVELRASAENSLITACTACHSPHGDPVSKDIPIIAGQPFTVIEDALILFAAGKRPCTVMCAIAAGLSSEEIQALAGYLEQQAYISAFQGFDPGLAALGGDLHVNSGCENCHSRGGRDGQGMAPVLAGQRTPYLRKALLQIRAGMRKGPKVMNQAISGLDDNDIEALLNFYAGNRSGLAHREQRTGAG